MSEKLTESITFKCTHEEKKEFEAIAKAEKTDISKLSRACMNQKISEVREYLNSLRAFASLTTDTGGTDFELTSEPRMIDVTPKIQAQKKPNCCDQMSFFAVHSEK
ncbi:hypothetical protein [Acinetobacter indicus]|uniref:hypothetical protein n=1 Tax=Acinetobacter indicus TaxID=756892 RepID=UPI003988D043